MFEVGKKYIVAYRANEPDTERRARTCLFRFTASDKVNYALLDGSEEYKYPSLTSEDSKDYVEYKSKMSKTVWVYLLRSKDNHKYIITCVHNNKEGNWPRWEVLDEREITLTEK